MKDRNAQTTREAALQAAEWIVRLESPGRQTRDDLRQWLRESPDNVNELAQAIVLDNLLRRLDPERRIDVQQLMSAAGSNVVSLGSRLHPPSYRIRLVGATLACALTAGFIALWLILTSAPFMLGSGTVDYETSQHQRVKLPDGSSIEMAAKSKLRVRLDKEQRTAVLSAGQVTFTIAADPNAPFLVHVGGIVLQTNGAKFDVSRQNRETQVSVAAGRLRIRPETTTGVVDYDYDLSPGAQLYFFDSGERDTGNGRIKIVRAAPAPALFAALGSQNHASL